MSSKHEMSWQYNEFQQVGRDYADAAEVSVYDASHADFRDIRADAIRVLDLLGAGPGAHLIDFGCGTGTFAVEAARRCACVDAVDVSQPMLGLAEKKATDAGLANIRFHHAGFLTYEHSGPAVDFVTSTYSFHHLPDFWKSVALTRLAALLRPGGLLYLHDVVIAADDAVENINAFIARQEKAGGAFLKEDAEGHFRDEFSTFDWVLEGLLERAGFSIRSKTMDAGVLGTYICAKL